jgi:hypothetical protein
LAPDGRILDCSGYSNASTADPVIELLESTIQELKTAPGKPLVKPVPLSVPPKTEPDSLVLHLTARYLPSGGVWGRVPAENWIVLKQGEWRKLLPPEDAQVGMSWDIDPDLAKRLLLYFYPPSPNNNLAKNRIEEQALTATLVSDKGGVARARIDGRLKMNHFFLPLGDDHTVVAKVVGYVDFDLGKKKIGSVRIVTDKATYATGSFGVAVRSVP